MKRKTKILVASVVSATILSVGFMAQSTFAQSNTTQQSLVSEIATKFNLKQSDVQAIFDQHAHEQQAKHAQAVETKLNEAVTNGSITSQEKDLILAKQKEVMQQLQQIKAMPNASDRKAALQKLQSDLQAWAKQNNIDPKWLRSFGARSAKTHIMKADGQS